MLSSSAAAPSPESCRAASGEPVPLPASALRLGRPEPAARMPVSAVTVGTRFGRSLPEPAEVAPPAGRLRPGSALRSAGTPAWPRFRPQRWMWRPGSGRRPGGGPPGTGGTSGCGCRGAGRGSRCRRSAGRAGGWRRGVGRGDGCGHGGGPCGGWRRGAGPSGRRGSKRAGRTGRTGRCGRSRRCGVRSARCGIRCAGCGVRGAGLRHQSCRLGGVTRYQTWRRRCGARCRVLRP